MTKPIMEWGSTGDWKVLDRLRSTKYQQVLLLQLQSDPECKCVAKLADKDGPTWRNLFNEYMILTTLKSNDHFPFPFEISCDLSKAALCVSFCSGENVLSLSLRDELDAYHVKVVMRGLLAALDYMQSFCIVHGNLKPEHILFDKESEKVSIVGFGVSQVVENGRAAYPRGFTREYAPPEAFLERKSLTAAWDVWSCGVVMYALLTGYFPFDYSRHSWSQSRDTLEIPVSSSTSLEAISLLDEIFVINPTLRPTAEELLQHSYFHSGSGDE